MYHKIGKHPDGVEILLDHLRVHFERQPDEEACVLEAKEASDDELEAKHQEAVALTTILRVWSRMGRRYPVMGRNWCLVESWLAGPQRRRNRRIVSCGSLETAEGCPSVASDRRPQFIFGHDLSRGRRMPPRKLCGPDQRLFVFVLSWLQRERQFRVRAQPQQAER